MKMKEDLSKQITISDWRPEGAYPVRPHSLSQQEKDHIFKLADAKKHKNRDDFIKHIEVIIGSFHAAKDFRSRTTPKQVRDRLERLQKYSKSLMKEMEQLDEYSIQLLSKAGVKEFNYVNDEVLQQISKAARGPDWNRPKIEELPDGTINVGVNNEKCKGFTFDEASVAVWYVDYHAGIALEKIKNYPKHRLKELERHNLACDVALGLKSLLGIEPTSNIDGIFSNVLRAVLEYAGLPIKEGTDIVNRDVRGLVEAAIEHINSVNE